MDRQAARSWLGVGPGAGPDDAVAAYQRLSRPLKRKLLDATRATQMRRYRGELSRLVRARDAFLGRKRKKDGAHGEAAGHLLSRLARTQVLELDRRSARRFLGLPAYATETQVVSAYDSLARILVRRMTLCTDDSELSAVNRARRRLRTIRETALA